MPKQQPELRVRWGKRDEGGRLDGDGALVYIGHPSTAGLLSYTFETRRVYETGEVTTLAKMLDAAGYDLKTLRFSIRKKQTKE